MKKRRERRTTSVDAEHMRRMHHEALEQLDLLSTAMEAAEPAGGTARDTLEDMAVDHWNFYLDVLHMISLHDDILAAVLTKHGMAARESDGFASEPVYGSSGSRPVLLPLIAALSRRHRRFFDVYGWRGNPVNDYLKESLTAEREHMAELIALIQEAM